jgi:putative flippase GtrA
VKKLIRYTTVSLSATSLDFCVFFLLSVIIGFHAVIGTFFSTIAGACVSWFLNHRWVFRVTELSKYKARLRFALGVLLSILLNVALAWACRDGLQLSNMASRIIAASTVWALLFFYNQRVVFKV